MSAMYDYDNDEFYYEPTMADEIFNRAKKELEECLKKEIKDQIKSTMDYNFKLRQENQELRQQIAKLDSRERDLANREAQFERTALRKVFSELLKPLEEQMEVYSVDYEYVKKDKCDKCDTNRRIYYKSPSGKDVYEECSCNKSYRVYSPKPKIVKTVNIFKDRDKSKFAFNVKYESRDYDEGYCKFEVDKLIENIDDMGDLSKLNEYQMEYNTGFKNKEDCQKYCDYLNKKYKVPKTILDKIIK